MLLIGWPTLIPSCGTHAGAVDAPSQIHYDAVGGLALPKANLRSLRKMLTASYCTSMIFPLLPGGFNVFPHIFDPKKPVSLIGNVQETSWGSGSPQTPPN